MNRDCNLNSYIFVHCNVNLNTDSSSFFRSEQSYNSHALTMPWPSVPYADAALRQDLTECFDVRGIPYLVLIDGDGNVITDNGRAEVAEDPDGLVTYKRRPSVSQ